METQKVKLTSIISRLRNEYGYAGNYQHVWVSAVAGKFPAENRGRAWYVDPGDVPLIAATLMRTYRPRGKI